MSYFRSKSNTRLDFNKHVCSGNINFTCFLHFIISLSPFLHADSQTKTVTGTALQPYVVYVSHVGGNKQQADCYLDRKHTQDVEKRH